MPKPIENNIDKLFKKVSEVISEARKTVYQTANTQMVKAYWQIGKLIVEEEQNGKERATYGKEIVKQLSAKLAPYGNIYSKRNLWYMVRFYQAFPIVNALRSQLSWTHYRLLSKIENENARNFYIEETIKSSWSTRTLERQINNLYYQRILSSKDIDIVAKEAEEKTQIFQVSDIIKDPYVLDFLSLKDNKNFRETELEQAIVNKLQEFILELGRGFAFVGRQYRLTTETGKHFYTDLVFYNYILKCFLIIDLKVASLTHQDIGQMDMYVRYFEENIRQKDDNPTIGLILCTEKDKTIVKYSLLNESEQIFASKYITFLPTEEELQAEIEKERKQIEIELSLNKENPNA